MLAYLILAGNNGAPVDPGLIARFDQDDPPEVPFCPDERIVWRNHDSSVVFFGWQAFTEVAGIGSHWASDERGLTAFTGHCWPRETGWVLGAGQSWAAQLRAYLGDATDLPAFREALFGHFTVISLQASGPGGVMPDWASVDQLFTAETQNVTAISNRAGLCARATLDGPGAPQRSLAAAGWIIGEGWILDQESSYWEVERPRAGSMVVLDPRCGAQVDEPVHSPLYPSETEDPTPTYENVLDEVECDLRTTIRALARLPVEQRVLSLSGGKDSRTLLAVILSEGVQDRFQFVTHGSPERADPIVAKALADRFGLDWTLRDPTDRSALSELDNVLRHSNLVEGMTSSWAAMERPAFAPGVTINGTMGEGLRWGFVTRAGITATSVDDILAVYERLRPFDRLGVLRPEVRAYYTGIISQRFREHADLGIPLVSLPALFMHETAMQARTGPDAVWNSRLRVDPFMTPACMRSSHRLPVDRRPDLRFHLDLQRRCNVELSKMPFERTAWYQESMYAHLPDAEDYRRIETVTTQNAGGRSWRVKHYAEYRPFIERIVLDRENPIHEITEFEPLAGRIAKGDASEGRARLIWGVLSAAVWMGNHEQPAKLSRG